MLHAGGGLSYIIGIVRRCMEELREKKQGADGGSIYEFI